MATLTASQKRKKVVNAIKSREKKNTYTQGANRTKVDKGYGDCSATTRWAYLSTLGIDIGLNTVAQIQSSKGFDVDTAAGYLPNEKNLLPGDCLYFKGTDKSRPFQVGHVEMYIGDGKIIGHGSGIGPTIKDMKTYCLKRYNSGKGYIKARRFIKDDETATTTTESKTTTTTETTSKGTTEKEIIKKLQTALNKDIKAGLVVDGIRGTLTNNAIKKYVANNMTKGEMVGWCQSRLNSKNKAGLSVDKIYGPKTKSATITFQKKKKYVTKTGKFTYETIIGLI